jgi:hypothetical protein
MIVRIGPVIDDRGKENFVFAPLSAEVHRDAIVFSEDDRDGYGAVMAQLPGRSFSCEPENENAGAAAGLSSRELTGGEARLAVEIALGLRPLEGIPDVTEAAWRRMFFSVLGDAGPAPATLKLTEGGNASGIVTGKVAQRPVDAAVTVAFRGNPVPTLVLTLDANAGSAPFDVDVTMTPEPQYLRDQIKRAYWLDAVPRVLRRDVETDRTWYDSWLPVLTASIGALANLPASGNAARITLSEKDGGPLTAEFALTDPA